MDDIDGLITERRFDEAVEVLAKELNSKKFLSNSYQKRIQERVQILTDLLCREIQNPAIKVARCNRVINYLIQLNEPILARDTFLQTKFNTIAKSIR
jgi:hypothetical protein